MLQIKEIKKYYRTGSLLQKALDGITLNLRSNEFVAILGPSGSGKTTLLNIIGGLDRYDSGDLIINHISTEKYRDRDWDSYRNHSVGFVFQSYNLIPHQNILSNVELALTISGISGPDRKRRALDALEKVGLKGQEYKKPNQMSGGQMQRVAIARALVNNPDIVLADEPTGALDSETSVQVMELLKEVAKDRLVVMVTHNPELARRYATRIVNLKDGVIQADSDPYVPEEENEPAVHRNMGHSSMSFLTALSLSFHNLTTKKARTFLVSFAGSIGIIGIALILSLSNGVNQYIKDTEEETLSEYPIQILRENFDFGSLLGNSGTETTTEESRQPGKAEEIQMLGTMLSSVSNNDLASLKAYFDSGKSGIEPYAKAIEYNYPIVPNIYLQTAVGKAHMVNPNRSFRALGMDLSGQNVFSSSMNMNVFSALPEKKELYESQYDVKAGHWPKNANEAVVVLSQSGNASDLMLYMLGLKDYAQMEQYISQMAEQKDVEIEKDDAQYAYEDFLKTSYKVVSPSAYYSYDSSLQVWKDYSDDQSYIEKITDTAMDLKIAGVVMPKENGKIRMLNMGIYYHPGLIEKLRRQAEESAVVKDQLAHPEVNVLTGGSFGKESSPLAMEQLFRVDQSAFKQAFRFDPSALTMDPSVFQSLDFTSAVNPSVLSTSLPTISEDLFKQIMKNVNVKIDSDEAHELARNLTNGYLDYAAMNPKTDYRNMGAGIQQYMTSLQGQQMILDQFGKLLESSGASLVTQEQLTAAVSSVMAGYGNYATEQGLDAADVNTVLPQYLSSPAAQQLLAGALQQLMNALPENLQITPEQLASFAAAMAQDYSLYAEDAGLPDPSGMQASFQQYLETPEGKQLLKDGIEKTVNTEELKEQLQASVSGLSADSRQVINDILRNVTSSIGTQISNAMSNAMGQISGNLSDAFKIDTAALSSAFRFDMSQNDLEALMRSMMSSTTSSYENNMKTFGYAAVDDLSEITIYPYDFKAKEQITDILTAYNERMEIEQPEKMISYTDLVGTLMSSVTTIINTISYVLVAFVAISLIVSSIMIGVITYISVLERKKEIGILRAMGASKQNVAQVFNAETFITGLLSGLIGIGLSLLILIPANRVIHSIAGNTRVNAFLQPQAAAALILLSITLTLIGGLIPSRKAAGSDPVTALRTE